MILILIKYYFLKKNHILQRIYLNTLSDVIIMMLFRPLCIRIPQMTGYARTFDGNATISF